MVNLGQAYAACLDDARSHYENFPVASILVPKAQRAHIAAVYAFARAADDFADEGERTVGERHRLIDAWLCRLREAASGEHTSRAVTPGEPPHTEAIFIAVGATMREHELPLEL